MRPPRSPGPSRRTGLVHGEGNPAGGGDRFTTLTQGANTVDTQTNLVDTVVHYLGHHSPVDPRVEGGLTVE